MTKQDKEQLWIEIEHIFDSGANETRIFNMVEAFIEKRYQALNQPPVSGMLPLTKEHQCFENGHAFYLVCEIDNGRSKYGEHKCSRCGHVESFQYDYGSW